MKILVTGSNGLLGQHLVRLLLRNHFSVIATGKGPSRLPFVDDDSYQYHDVDLRDYAAIHQLFVSEQPEVVVHAAAITQVDECELNRELCSEVNVEGTAQLLVVAEQFSRFFVYLSTDFVFDGEQGNYTEDDPANPLSWYGFTKVQAESMVETSEISWAIVRTCLVYGNTVNGTRGNIISWVKDNLEQGKEIKVVNDQLRTPTYVEDLAQGILLIIQKNATGIYHISGKDVMTPYQMARSTAHLLSLNLNLITEVDASTFSQPGKRPLKTGFVINKARNELGYEPLTFEEGLRRMFAEPTV